MTALPTPSLVDLDDPLAPRRAPAPTPSAEPAPAPPARRRSPSRARAAAERPPVTEPPPTTPAHSLADEPLVAVFARMPESLSERLADTVRALNAGRSRRARVSQQDVLGALVDHHATADDPVALAELVDAYRQRIRG